MRGRTPSSSSPFFFSGNILRKKAVLRRPGKATREAVPKARMQPPRRLSARRKHSAPVHLFRPDKKASPVRPTGTFVMRTFQHCVRRHLRRASCKAPAETGPAARNKKGKEAPFSGLPPSPSSHHAGTLRPVLQNRYRSTLPLSSSRTGFHPAAMLAARFRMR